MPNITPSVKIEG